MNTPDVDSNSGRSGGFDNIDFILDIPLEVTVRLGSAKLPIKELLELGAGSVIELNRLAGDPLEVLVNNKLVARGEAVVVNDKFGIRLTEIIAPTERILGLKP
ncbi:MAG: flagellar motor switch protein FliN [Myxococcales bacterium]|nr:flagellar motor switch protein FliN [Myxococcales bacterium]